jgi:hypothetical protein
MVHHPAISFTFDSESDREHHTAISDPMNGLCEAVAGEPRSWQNRFMKTEIGGDSTAMSVAVR